MNLKEMVTFLDKPIRKKSKTRVLGSFLVVLVGGCLFLDKVLLYLGVEGGNNFGFYSYADFIWVLMSSFVPVGLGVVFLVFRPYIVFFLVPLYCYIIQMIWIFQPHIPSDDVYLNLYVSGICITIFLTITSLGIQSSKKFDKREKYLRGMIQKEAKEIIEILKGKLD